MAEAMISFAKQRWLGLLLLIACSVIVVGAHAKYAASIPRFAYLTGWVLFGVMFLLTAYNARKRIPFLPALSSESWLQFHIYAGWLTAVLFLVHVSYRVPTGWFEGVLTWLYGLVMVSGVFGLVISRDLPKRMATRGSEVLFERIPAIRANLRERAETLALTSVPDVKSITLADFYVRELREFFDGPRNTWQHIFEVRAALNRLLNRINDLNRYLNEKERATLSQIAELVRQKDGLDYHYALQLLLKGWLFMHIPLTYAMLLWTLAHIVIVFAFSGGAR